MTAKAPQPAPTHRPSPVAAVLDKARGIEGYLEHAHEHSCHPQDRIRWQHAVEELRELQRMLAKAGARHETSDDDLQWILS